MTWNTWKQFEDLIPKDPLLVADVITHNADGTSSVQLVGGGLIRVRGTTVATGQKAFVRGGQIEGAAPNLPFSDLVLY